MSFFENAQQWPLMPLKSVATLKRGYDLPTKSRTPGSVPIYAANGQNGTHNEVKKQGPGVVTGRSGTIGKVHYVDKGYWPLNTSLYVTDFHGNHPRWIYYLLSAFRLNRFVEGAGVPTLNRNLVHDELIPVPPLAEQKRIAAILDKADAIRHKRQQAIELADEFLRSVFLDMFGDPMRNPKQWQVCKFEDLIDGVTYGLTVRPQYHETGIPLISAREIKSGEIDFTSCPRINTEDFNKLSAKAKPQSEDILFSKTGSIGHCALVQTNETFAITQNAARITVNTDICNPIFLLNLLRTKYFYDLANKEAKGNAVKDLQLGVMKSFPMYLPPIEEQEKFQKVYLKIIETKSSLNKSQELSSNNFSSVSQKAFSGDL